jgi:predicted Zn finger-like uncharacterized protein
MAIEFTCPVCKSGLRVGDDTTGKVVRCGNCLTTVRVPAGVGAGGSVAGSPDVIEAPPDRPGRPDRRPGVEPVAPPSGRPRGRPSRYRPPPSKGRGAGFWILVVLGILALLMVVTCAGLIIMFQPKWHTHKSTKGGFEVELPGPLRPNMEEMAKVKNPDDFHVEGTFLPFEGEVFVVMYGDINANDRQNKTDEQILDEVVKGMREDDPQLQIVRSTPITVSGFPGRELVVSHPDGTGVYRIVVAEDRLYVVFAGGHDAAESSAQVRRFLDSFKITDPTLLARAEKRKRDKEQADAAQKQQAEVKKNEAARWAESLAARGNDLAAAEGARRERAGQLAEQVGAAADRAWANVRPQPQPIPVAPPQPIPVAPPPRLKNPPGP